MEPLLKLSAVTKIYNSNGVMAVGMKSVTASFDIGEFVAVTGESGSGKSTLLNVLSGMDSYEEGAMYLAGEDISYYTETDREEYRRKYVSFVFQDYFIIDSYTALQNVELALFNKYADKKARRARALELLAKVGLSGRAKHKGTKLSGGEKQRVSIARALAKDSPIIFADEPTGNLDSKSGAEILKLLSEAAADKLVIVVTHDYEELKGYATRRIRMFDGNLIEDAEVHQADKKDWAPLFIKAPLQEIKPEKSKPTRENAGELSVAAFLERIKAKVRSAAEYLKPRLSNVKKKTAMLAEVASNNLKAAPKRSMFSAVSMYILAVGLIAAMGSVYYLDIIENYTSYNYYLLKSIYRYSMVVTNTDGSAMTEADYDALESIGGISCVVDSFFNAGGRNYPSDLVVSYEEKVKALVGWRHGYIKLADIQHLPLAGGRMPQNDDELLLYISNCDAAKALLGETIEIDYEFSADHIETKSYTVTGYIIDMVSKSFDVCLSTNEYVRLRSEPEELYDIDDQSQDIYAFLQRAQEYFGWDIASYTMIAQEFQLRSPSYAAEVVLNEYGYDLNAYYKVEVDAKLNRTLTVYFPYNADRKEIEEDIKAMGYNVYYFYIDTYDLDALTAKVMVYTIFTLFSAFTIMLSSRALKTVSELKKRDFAVMRAVGFPDSFMKSMYMAEVLFTALLAWAASVITALGALFIFSLSKTGGAVFAFYLLKFNAAYLVGLVFKTLIFISALGLIIAARFNSKFYKRSVRNSLVSEV